MLTTEPASLRDLVCLIDTETDIWDCFVIYYEEILRHVLDRQFPVATHDANAETQWHVLSFMAYMDKQPASRGDLQNLPRPTTNFDPRGLTAPVRIPLFDVLMIIMPWIAEISDEIEAQARRMEANGITRQRLALARGELWSKRFGEEVVNVYYQGDHWKMRAALGIFGDGRHIGRLFLDDAIIGGSV